MAYAHPPAGVFLPYNHPPLTGWLLDLLYTLSHHGVSFSFLIRMPATLADVVTTLVVFELVRSYRPLREATAAGIMVACSPVLILISGYHGNTDPVFTMLTLLSAYLLVVRRMPASSGLVFAMGLSIKLVPIVVLPMLLLVVWRAGRRQTIAFLAASGAFMLLLWGPVVLRDWGPFKTKVLSYGGIPQRQWGIVQFLHGAGAPAGVINAMVGPGRWVILLAAALLPVWLAWRRPDQTLPAIGLTYMIFLLLNTATSVQYLAWPAAGVFLVNIWSALVYNLAAGAFLLQIYDYWNRAHPWHWKAGIAWSGIWTLKEVIAAGVVWAVLLVVTILGLLPGRRSADAVGDPPPTGSDGARGPRILGLLPRPRSAAPVSGPPATVGGGTQSPNTGVPVPLAGPAVAAGGGDFA